MKINDIKLNPQNPRKISNADLEKLQKSINDFERMMSIRKIIIDENNVVLGGNQRLKALKELGYKDIPDGWIEQVTDLTEDQKREFIIKDNAPVSGEWDWEILDLEWNDVELGDWGLSTIPLFKGDINDFFEQVSDNKNGEENPKTLKCPHCGEIIEL